MMAEYSSDRNGVNEVIALHLIYFTFGYTNIKGWFIPRDIINYTKNAKSNVKEHFVKHFWCSFYLA